MYLKRDYKNYTEKIICIIKIDILKGQRTK